MPIFERCSSAASIPSSLQSGRLSDGARIDVVLVATEPAVQRESCSRSSIVLILCSRRRQVGFGQPSAQENVTRSSIGGAAAVRSAGDDQPHRSERSGSAVGRHRPRERVQGFDGRRAAVLHAGAERAVPADLFVEPEPGRRPRQQPAAGQGDDVQVRGRDDVLVVFDREREAGQGELPFRNPYANAPCEANR